MTTKSGIHRHPSKRSALFLATAAAALVATTPFSEAATDPQVTAAVTAASTANIEDIVTLGIATSGQIGSGAIKLNKKNISVLAKGLADAIVAKPAPASQTDPLDPNYVNRSVNKVDELGEVAAYIFNGIAGNKKVVKDKKGKNAVLVMKSVLKTAAATVDLVASGVIRDVVGSVALTIHDDPRLDAIEAKIAKALGKAAKKIAGKANKNIVTAALAEGFGGSVAFETGINALFAVADPETDNRNG